MLVSLKPSVINHIKALMLSLAQAISGKTISSQPLEDLSNYFFPSFG
jgi:hypothetical protein